MIDLKFEKLYRYPRLQEPCAVTIPLPEGRVTEPDKVCVYQKGVGVPTQTKVLSRHKDGSARYLFVRFQADLPGNAGTMLQCDLGQDSIGITDSSKPMEESSSRFRKEVSCENSGILCKEIENGYEIICGKLKFSVRNNSTELFDSFSDGLRSYTSEQFQGPFIKTEGEFYGIRFGCWKIQELGAVCVVLTTTAYCVGTHSLECDCRITAYANKPWIELSFQLKNKTENPLPLEEWKFSVKMDKKAEQGSEEEENRKAFRKEHSKEAHPISQCKEGTDILQTTGIFELPQLEEKLDTSTVRTCVGTANYKTRFTMAQNATPLQLLVDAEFLMKEGTEHLAEVFYGTFFADYTDSLGGVCATIYQAHQNYPKAVKVDGYGIQIMLVPEGSDGIIMESGMAREQRFQLHFHNSQESLTEINNRSLIYQMPDRPVIASHYFREANVMPEIFLNDNSQRNFDAEAWMISRADSHARCFGMLNWGDAPDPGYTAQGRALGELVWTNNEYDFPHACALLYARTGIRRFLDYCLVAGSHWKDVDVCHYSKNPLLMGGQWEHTGGHVKNGSIVCSHEWVEGLIDCYHFTGDSSYLDTAVGIGENVLRLLETPMYQNSGELSARETGWALRTLTALYTETKENRWIAKADWIVGQFREWSAKFGHWLAPYTDNVLIRVPFMISVAVGSLMRYYQEFPSQDVKEMILDAVDDMVENSMFDNGYFYYKEIPSLTRLGTNTLILEALTYAYRLTGKRSYLEAGLKTFENTLRTPPDYVVFPKRVVKDAVLYGAQPTKEFAQSFLPMTVYYTAAAEEGFWE